MENNQIIKLLFWASGAPAEKINLKKRVNKTTLIFLGLLNIALTIASIFIFYYLLHDTSEHVEYPDWLIIILSVFGSVLLFFLIRVLFSFQGNITRLFWWCSGANIDLLEDCPTEHSKYFGIGGTILFTALMATFAGGYAFYTSFFDAENPLSSTITAVIFAVFWGSLIFNLDRYIVSTFGTGDGKKTISWGEFKSALPRLIMAIILGLVIAIPLELKIFNKSIDLEIEKMKTDERKTLFASNSQTAKLDTVKSELLKIDVGLESANSKINNIPVPSNLQNELDQATINYNTSSTAYNRIHENWRINHWLPTGGKEYRDTLDISNREERHELAQRIAIRKYRYRTIVIPANNRMNVDKEIIDDVNNRIVTYRRTQNQSLIDQETMLKDRQEVLIQQRTVIESGIRTQDTIIESRLLAYNGLLAKLIAMDRLMYTKDEETGEEKKTPVFYAKWMITLLFVLIEIAPILFKMMMEEGPYDYKVNRLKRVAENREKKILSDFNEKISLELKLNSNKNEKRLQTELKMNDEIITDVELATTRIAKKAIKEWEKKQKDRDPDDFIKTT